MAQRPYTYYTYQGLWSPRDNRYEWKLFSIELDPATARKDARKFAVARIDKVVIHAIFQAGIRVTAVPTYEVKS